jgi:hypothetical protein
MVQLSCGADQLICRGEPTRAGGGIESSDDLGNCREVFSLRSFANETRTELVRVSVT